MVYLELPQWPPSFPSSNKTPFIIFDFDNVRSLENYKGFQY